MEYLTVTQVVEMTGYALSTIYQLNHKKELTPIRRGLGKTVFYDKAEVERLIKRKLAERGE